MYNKIVMEQIIQMLNHHPFFSGCVMFIMNIGSKYLIKEFPDTIDFFFNEYKFLRYLVIFCIAFVATRNIKISILLTLLLILVIKFLLEPNSKFSLINKDRLNIHNKLEQEEEQRKQLNNIVPEHEYRRALQIVKMYHS